MVFFIADAHFGHENIIKLCSRPFSGVQEMNRQLVLNWNAKVTDEDEVYILGDLFFKCDDVHAILNTLKGKKHLILGNHDEWIRSGEYNKYFVSIRNFKEIYYNGTMLTLCHYPLIEWNGSLNFGKKKSFLIYGHIHNQIKPEYYFLFKNEYALNAGVEINGYAPVTIEELIENNKKYTAENQIKLADPNM